MLPFSDDFHDYDRYIKFYRINLHEWYHNEQQQEIPVKSFINQK